MKNGEFKKEGSISELKHKYGGFSIKLKLKGNFNKKGFDEVDSSEDISNHDIEVIPLTNSSGNDIIKEDVENTFRGKAEECEIKDEHSVRIELTVNNYNVS